MYTHTFKTDRVSPAGLPALVKKSAEPTEPEPALMMLFVN